MVVCVAGIVLSLVRMAPAGMDGNVHTVKFWFGALVVFLMVGSPATIAFYYYRVQLLNDVDEQQRVAVNTLANLGQQRKQSRN